MGRDAIMLVDRFLNRNDISHCVDPEGYAVALDFRLSSQSPLIELSSVCGSPPEVAHCVEGAF